MYEGMASSASACNVYTVCMQAEGEKSPVLQLACFCCVLRLYMWCCVENNVQFINFEI